MQKLGKFLKESEGYKIEFERILPYDILTVWDAITNPEKLKWWFTDIEMELQVGNDIKFIFRDESKTTSFGKIIKIDPPHTFIWSWENELAQWHLEKISNTSCKLLFTYSRLDPAWAVSTVAGFHTLLNRLEQALDGKTEYYDFGANEYDPAQFKIKEDYGNSIYDSYPELEVYHPIKLEKAYPHPIERVWRAISDKDELRNWYFDFSEQFNLNTGHVFEWSAGPPDGKKWLHRGKITEILPGTKLAYTWEYPGYAGKAEAIWELVKVNESLTKLIFTFKILVPFDRGEPALSRKNFVEGWEYIVMTGLEQYLNS